MQLAAVWRMPIGTQTGFTLAGGPSAEPALGPVAFMHRASAMENPMSPLAHHTFDSTHIAFGVVTAAVDHGPWTIEASVFNGREPDEDRWDFDFGALDSYSARLWFRPRDEWEFQFSSGRLKNPEELGHGDDRPDDSLGVMAETATARTSRRPRRRMASTTAKTRTAERCCSKRRGVRDGIRRMAASSSSKSKPACCSTTDTLGHDVKDMVAALTLGVVRELPRWRRLETGIGAAATFYGVPDRLAPTYGKRPVSFQVFFRLRPAPGADGTDVEHAHDQADASGRRPIRMRGIRCPEAHKRLN